MNIFLAKSALVLRSFHVVALKQIDIDEELLSKEDYMNTTKFIAEIFLFNGSSRKTLKK